MSPESAELWKSIFEIAGVVLLALTFLAGLGFWYFGGKVSEFQKERLRTFDKDLTAAKDELSIQEQRAAEAERQLELVKQSTANAEKDVSQANQRAGEANEKAAEANKAAEELRQKNLETENILGQETDKRLELEKSLAPRIIALQSIRGKFNIDPLKSFKGINVLFEILPDAEAQRAAGNLAWLLKEAGWNVLGASINPAMNQSFFDGVVVSHRVYPGVPTAESVADRSEDAADALIDFLHASNWEASPRGIFPQQANELAANTVKISIGLKPFPYFFPEQLKEGLKQLEKSREQSKRMKEEMKEREKYFEELLRRNPPPKP